MNFKKYWEFFSQKNCTKALKLEFFKNGYFAICYANCIEIYSADCELLQTLFHCNAKHGYKILTNGMIVKFDASEICVIAKDGVELENPYVIKCNNPLGPIVSGSLILTISANNSNGEVLIYRVYRNKQPQIINSLGKMCCPSRIKASHDSEIYVIRYSSGVESIFKGNEKLTSKIITPDLEKQCLRAIDMLPSGSFIARFDTKCILFDKDFNRLAIAPRTYGIAIRGANFIGFEEKLLLNSSGDIVSEEVTSIQNITCDGTLLFSHKIVNSDGVGHYLGGELWDASASNFRLGTKMAIIYSQEMIFPLSFIQHKRGDVLGRDLYHKRLKEMLTH